MVRESRSKTAHAAAEVEGALAPGAQAKAIEDGDGVAYFPSAAGEQLCRVPPAASAGVVHAYGAKRVGLAELGPARPDLTERVAPGPGDEVWRASPGMPDHGCRAAAATEPGSRTVPNAASVASPARARGSGSGACRSMSSGRLPRLRFSQIDAISHKALAPWRQAGCTGRSTRRRRRTRRHASARLPPERAVRRRT